MRAKRVYWIALFLLLAATCNAADEETRRFDAWRQTVKHPVLRVPCVQNPPKIDGKLDPIYTRLAKPITLRKITGVKIKPTYPTTAWILSDKRFLYIFARCLTPFPDAVLAKIQKRDKNIFHDETVEIFVDPTSFREDMYYHILVNAIGTTGDIRNRDDPGWNPDLKVKTAREPKKAWLMEIRIPFADLDVRPGKMNKVWSFNLNRTARPEPKPPLGINDVEIEDTAWSPTYTDTSHRPQMFGYLWLDAGTVYNTKQDEMVRASIDVESQRPERAVEMEDLPLDGEVNEAAIIREYATPTFKEYAFETKPAIARQGDRVTIAFEVKAYCDVTVAIEDLNGRILRHLASGVLGPKAPAPFAMNSLKQAVVWDGKDDKGRYIDDKDQIRIRVSLGLKPAFERTLFWSPQKRWGTSVPAMRATKEGVYVFDNNTNPTLRLFDHDGNYIRTVYPFPANKMHRLVGVQTKTFPHDGKRLPLKYSHPQCALLTTPDLRYGKFWPTGGKNGTYARAMDVLPGDPSRIYIVNLRLNRLAGDGTTGGLPLSGPQTCYHSGTATVPVIGPSSAAVSPDGKWLYLTGFLVAHDALHGVVRMDPKGDKEPELFAGVLRRRGHGTDNKHFKMPTSVACDSRGRVYVGDYLNDRIQVYDSNAKLLATIKTKRPSRVRIHPKTNEIYVFAWPVPNYFGDRFRRSRQAFLTHYKALPASLGQPEEVAQYSFSIAHARRGVTAEIDFWTPTPTVWMAPAIHGGNWQPLQIRLISLQNGQTTLKRDFAKDIRKKVYRYKSPNELRQRIWVNPKTGKLWVGEYTRPHAVHCKWFKEMIRIDPATGRPERVRLPMDAEDVAFDMDGHAYLRSPSGDYIVRFDPTRWREVPFDYGETRGKFISGLVIPGHSDGGAMSGGFSISTKGNIAIHCAWKVSVDEKDKKPTSVDAKKSHDPFLKHAPEIFPGRWVGHELHVFDKHGRWLFKDALPGIERTDGLHIDKDDFLYMTLNQTRSCKGKRYFNDISCTFLKAKAGKARILTNTAARVPLPPSEQPERPAEIVGHALGAAWLEGGEWMHGAVGLNGRSVDNSKIGRNCDCIAKSHSDLDLFRRAFVPEVDHYSVIVLDTNGNPIIRIGRYGNVEDGQPLIANGGPKATRRIGGDEVAIFHAMNVATHTDRRLFISDVGNQRILSVKLGYHAEEVVNLKDVTDGEGE